MKSVSWKVHKLSNERRRGVVGDVCMNGVPQYCGVFAGDYAGIVQGT